MVDPREAQDNYERACEAHHEACETYLAASRAWGRDYADKHYPVPRPWNITRPCDGSSTDSWESLEGVHGPVFGSNPDYSFAEHCDEMGLPSGERNAYLQRLEDRHARAAKQC
tara:strand:+ start:20 stop:358 length:339 start_codon:yes stop_codon:yes gene_type:complete